MAYYELTDVSEKPAASISIYRVEDEAVEMEAAVCTESWLYLYCTKHYGATFTRRYPFLLTVMRCDLIVNLLILISDKSVFR